MKISVFAILLFLTIGVFAAHNWERTNYRNSTILSASVWIDGKPAQAGDVVGAFVGDECRMIAKVFINQDTAYISSVVHGEVPEVISFKLWQQSSDKIIPVEKTLTSKPGDNIFLYRIDAK